MSIFVLVLFVIFSVYGSLWWSKLVSYQHLGTR